MVLAVNWPPTLAHTLSNGRRIEARLGSEPGVQRVKVSSAAREARVLFDPDRTTEHDIVAAIAQAGYHVIPPGR